MAEDEAAHESGRGADHSRHHLHLPERVRRLRALRVLPPNRRGSLAERRLRRPGAPGPASEHVIQYLVSNTLRARKDNPSANAIGIKQADFFYRDQYRQYLSTVAGAFAMTAPQALVASGTAARGLAWRRHRRTVAALVEGAPDAPPILVLDRGTVAVAVLLPREGSDEDRLIAGDRVAGTPGTVRERDPDGALVETVRAAVASGRLAILALHPHDPDAMGLHITLFGVTLLGAAELQADHALTATDLAAHSAAADAAGRRLAFLVGGTEEVFTQCSQNLFVKHPVTPGETAGDPHDPAQRDWPRRPLAEFLAAQFEALQVTVGHDGLPGASPRNGDIGRAAFVETRRGRTHVLIPYHPGNAIHGHAAKLWTNPYSSVVFSDDHSARRRVTLSGRSWIADQAVVARRFPATSAAVLQPEGPDGPSVPEPVYWFVMRLDDVVWERGTLAANRLDPGRAACTINAGGQGRHTKKPGYFAADTVDRYDLHLQHERERAGRPVDPDGAERRAWTEAVTADLQARRDHLATVATGA